MGLPAVNPEVIEPSQSPEDIGEEMMARVVGFVEEDDDELARHLLRRVDRMGRRIEGVGRRVADVEVRRRLEEEPLPRGREPIGRRIMRMRRGEDTPEPPDEDPRDDVRLITQALGQEFRGIKGKDHLAYLFQEREHLYGTERPDGRMEKALGEDIIDLGDIQENWETYISETAVNLREYFERLPEGVRKSRLKEAYSDIFGVEIDIDDYDRDVFLEQVRDDMYDEDGVLNEGYDMADIFAQVNDLGYNLVDAIKHYERMAITGVEHHGLEDLPKVVWNDYPIDLYEVLEDMGIGVEADEEGDIHLDLTDQEQRDVLKQYINEWESKYKYDFNVSRWGKHQLHSDLSLAQANDLEILEKGIMKYSTRKDVRKFIQPEQIGETAGVGQDMGDYYMKVWEPESHLDIPDEYLDYLYDIENDDYDGIPDYDDDPSFLNVLHDTLFGDITFIKKFQELEGDVPRAYEVNDHDDFRNLLELVNITLQEIPTRRTHIFLKDQPIFGKKLNMFNSQYLMSELSVIKNLHSDINNNHLYTNEDTIHQSSLSKNVNHHHSKKGTTIHIKQTDDGHEIINAFSILVGQKGKLYYYNDNKGKLIMDISPTTKLLDIIKKTKKYIGVHNISKFFFESEIEHRNTLSTKFPKIRVALGGNLHKKLINHKINKYGIGVLEHLRLIS